MAWLIDGGAAPDRMAAITFNKRAAEELGERLDAAVAPLGVAAGTVRVRTFHALGREILRDAGVDVRRWSTAPSCSRGCFPMPTRTNTAARHGLLAAEARPRRRCRGCGRGRGSRPDRPRVRRVRTDARARGRSISTISSAGRSTGSRRMPGCSTLARPLHPPARRRGAGRGSLAAPAGPAAGRAREPRVPRRRRRPVDLWLATRGRATCPGPGCQPAGTASRRPRGEPPLPRAGRRAVGRVDRPQPGAVRQDDPAAAGCGGLGHPCPGR